MSMVVLGCWLTANDVISQSFYFDRNPNLNFVPRSRCHGTHQQEARQETPGRQHGQAIEAVDVEHPL